MIAPRWCMHAFDVRPKTALVVIAHLTDECGSPMCGAESGERIAEIGSPAYPGGVCVLACVPCLLESTKES